MKLHWCIVMSALTLSGCHISTSTNIDSFCQDMNILFIQKNVVLSNILNINTTRTPEGGAYIPKTVAKCDTTGCAILPIGRPPILKYEPHHPDAQKNGYVEYPLINLEEEKQKLEKINMAIDFRLKSMPVKPDFFFSEEAQVYFKKYPMLDREMNFRKLVEKGQ